ncbi:osmoprotectant transport system permease protein [Altererythrobacter atlanticus]|uniref:Glycine betaine/carnitine/choline transport system permease protein OpuCB n=1 Tax=Croceibacterium atlanticum TaxID=1267766 RepID=A0A0F7KU24_9SPHN|nr:ABC transporter permease/substrate-binding protein [Croceibacterium atlanticum]AKH43089.1 Glycine betaine/carnitine/choline transport system permease protein OpuCB [Croceibacterium atlanticum]MBB5732207.1 osmoprotectant transport system permease protein [Croceibacterium atlanticum]
MNDLLNTLLGLGRPLAEHVLLSAAALALGIVIALPVAVWASRSPLVARIALGFAALIQTIPALALLALFFPVLLAMRAVFGEGLPTLGFLPALLALALYAVLPILRNAVTARVNMDAGVIEAADASGMTGWQKLRLVEAPITAPYIMAGIRTAAVWVIGAATLATTVGQPSLGDPIFAGLQTQNWVLVLAGCIASAGLALAADGLLGLMERGFASRRRGLTWAGIGLALAGVLAAALVQQGQSRETVVVGAKNFSEQFILARLIGNRLEQAGYDVRYRQGLGSAVIHGALTSGAIDVYVDYSGTIWANEMKREDTPPREEMIHEIARWEQDSSGTLLLGSLGFENAYAFAMRGDDAREAGIASLDDLTPIASTLTIGGDVEFFERPEWPAVRDTYGLQGATTRSFTATFMYDALQSGAVDAIAAFSSDGRIAADRLTVLYDPRRALPAYDALLLIAPDRKDDERFVRALRPLIGAIPVEAMREANYSVDREAHKRTPQQAAKQLAASISD